MGLVGQDTVLATVTEYLIVGTGEEFKRKVFMMEPPLCFLLLLGLERVQVNLLERLDRWAREHAFPKALGSFQVCGRDGHRSPVTWEWRQRSSLCVLGISSWGALESCLTERSSKTHNRVPRECLRNTFPGLILLNEQFISKDFLKSLEEVSPSGS